MDMNKQKQDPAAAAREVKRLLEADRRFSEKEIALLSRFAELVLQKNQVMNLTAITEPEAFYVKHLLDSLSLLPLIRELSEGRPIRLLDVGSGAGFPGIPLKIAEPGCDILLLDSLRKRTLFLDEVIKDLGLEKIRTLHARAEDAARRKDLREQFDIVTARAVASLPVLAELCLPFVKIGGRFLAMKGSQDELAEAAKALSILGAKLLRQHELSLPGEQGERIILEFIKQKPCPAKYPRKAGTPGKQPLI